MVILYNLDQPDITKSGLTLGQHVKWYGVKVNTGMPAWRNLTNDQKVAAVTPGAATTPPSGITFDAPIHIATAMDISTNQTTDSTDIYLHGQEQGVSIETPTGITGTIGMAIAGSERDKALEAGTEYEAMVGVKYNKVGTAAPTIGNRAFVFLDTTITGRTKNYPARGVYVGDINFTLQYETVVDI